MAVFGVSRYSSNYSNTSSESSQDSHSLEKTDIAQGLAAIARPFLSLASLGYAVKGSIGLAALCAGGVVASQERLGTNSERITEGMKEVLAFVPLLGSALQFVDGVCGIVTGRKLFSQVEIKESEAQALLTFGALGVLVDGWIKFVPASFKNIVLNHLKEMAEQVRFGLRDLEGFSFGGLTVAARLSAPKAITKADLYSIENGLKASLKKAGFKLGYEVSAETSFYLMDRRRLRIFTAELEDLIRRLGYRSSMPEDVGYHYDALSNLLSNFRRAADRALSDRLERGEGHNNVVQLFTELA